MRVIQLQQADKWLAIIASERHEQDKNQTKSVKYATHSTARGQSALELAVAAFSLRKTIYLRGFKCLEKGSVNSQLRPSIANSV